MPFRFAVLKGRSNYLCLQRLDELEADDRLDLDLEDDDDDRTGIDSETLVELRSFAAESETGDRAELESVMASVELDSTLGQLVQLRLARVMAASGDEAGAVAILVQGSSSFPASYAQALGDIHLATGREAEALLAYESAQTESLALGGQLGLVDLKVSGLSLRDADDSVEDSQ